MEINKNTQKIINVLRGHSRGTLSIIMTRTSLSEIIVLLELARLAKNNLIKVHRGFDLVTYTLNKDKYNCCWAAHAPGSGFWFCLYPELASKTLDDETQCRNDKTCSRHKFMDELDSEELKGG